jgi:acyl-homoserine lactone acylase PvdQ
LKKNGQFDEHANIYNVDEDLLFFRGKDKPKQQKMSHFYHEKWHHEEFIATPGGIGSNCWTVSGKHTSSGKPFLSCDPHLNKQLQSMWFLVGVAWKENF